MPFMLGLASLSLISRLELCTLPDELPFCLALLPSALPSIPSPLYTPSLTRYHMRQGTPDLPEVRTCSQADLKRRHTRRLETQDRRGTTVSVGVCGVQPSAELAFIDALATADRGLFEAKSTGRNRVCVAEPARSANGTDLPWSG